MLLLVLLLLLFVFVLLLLIGAVTEVFIGVGGKFPVDGVGKFDIKPTWNRIDGLVFVVDFKIKKIKI